MPRSGVTLVLVGVVFLGGCGGADNPKPPGSPRATVLRFLDDLQAGRINQACAALDPAEVADLRLNVLSSTHAPKRLDAAARRRWVQRLNASTRRCPVALRMLTAQLATQLPAVRAAAVKAPLTKPFPAELWTLGNQDWVVEPRKGRWVITNPDALFVAQEQSSS